MFFRFSGISRRQIRQNGRRGPGKRYPKSSTEDHSVNVTFVALIEADDVLACRDLSTYGRRIGIPGQTSHDGRKKQRSRRSQDRESASP